MVAQNKNVRKTRRHKCRLPRHFYGQWIKFQLSIRNVTQVEIAEALGVRTNAVWGVINGRMTSARIQQKIADKLGYPDWAALLAVAEKATKENIV